MPVPVSEYANSTLGRRPFCTRSSTHTENPHSAQNCAEISRTSKRDDQHAHFIRRLCILLVGMYMIVLLLALMCVLYCRQQCEAVSVCVYLTHGRNYVGVFGNVCKSYVKPREINPIQFRARTSSACLRRRLNALLY